MSKVQQEANTRHFLTRPFLAYGLLCLMALGVLGSIAPACSVIPFDTKISQSQELDYGRQADEQIQKLYTMSADKESYAWLARIGRKVLPFSDRPDIACTFRILDDTSINAFSVPGYVYVSAGLLDLIRKDPNRDEELAGVVACQLGHTGGRHMVNEIQEQQNGGILAALAGLVIKGKYGSSMVIGPDLYLLGHTKDDEYDADRRAVDTLARAGIDPSGLIALYQKLDILNRNGVDVEFYFGEDEDCVHRIYHVLQEIASDRAHGAPAPQAG